MRDELPKFHETFIPVLEVLSTGEVMHYNDLRNQVKNRFYSDLSDDALGLTTQNGDPLILNRIGWAKAYLKQAGYISQPKRGMVQITKKGRSILVKGVLTLADLRSDPEYVRKEVEKKKTKSEASVGVIGDESDVDNLSPQDLIDQGFVAIRKEVKSDLLEKLKSIDPYYFEKVILILLKKMGYGDFIETKKSGDGGIDGIINQDQLGLEKIFIQAKRYNSNKVRETDIRNFIGAMSGDTTKGVFVTTSEFDDAATKKAHDAHHKIILIDGEKLVDLMHQFNVGVQVRSVYEVKEVDEDFFE
jgi:restriction system protein